MILFPCNSLAKMWNPILSKSKPPLYSHCIHDLLMTLLITNVTILSRCIHPNMTYIPCWAIILPSKSRHLSVPFTHVASWWWRRRARERGRHGQSQCAIENRKQRRAEKTGDKSNETWRGWALKRKRTIEQDERREKMRKKNVYCTFPPLTPWY